MNIPIIPRWMHLSACVLLGLLIGWALWHPVAVHVETAAPSIILPDGAHVLERVPDAPVPESIKDAVKELPGAKLERAVTLTVKPKPKATTALNAATNCEPVHIDLGLVAMKDDTHRVIATSSDGEIVGGIDIPVQMPAQQRQLKWAMGALYDRINKRYGGFIDRDLGPFRLGIDVVRNNPDLGYRGYSVFGRIGIRF
jgi:hypothetical protein